MRDARSLRDIGRERRHCDIGIARVQIDRLSADENDGGALLIERVERVEEDAASEA